MLFIGDRRCHVRCRHCEARRVLPRHPDNYTRQPPACRGCGRRDYRADRYMNTRRTVVCECAGYWFKHRRGSLFCWHRADGTDRLPGDQDFNDRNHTLEGIDHGTEAALI